MRTVEFFAVDDDPGPGRTPVEDQVHLTDDGRIQVDPDSMAGVIALNRRVRMTSYFGSPPTDAELFDQLPFYSNGYVRGREVTEPHRNAVARSEVVRPSRRIGTHLIEGHHQLDSEAFKSLRRQVLRRVSYGANTAALRENRVPPDGPFDAALTNGLAAIVADSWPGAERSKRGWMKSARELLDVIVGRGDPFDQVDSRGLREGLDVSQPVRHGSADDESIVLMPRHLAALIALDEHPSLQILNIASKVENVDELIWVAFEQAAAGSLPWDPKDRLNVPDPDTCDECSRPTFLPSGWDAFGGLDAPGICIACGWVRTEVEAYERAIKSQLERVMSKPD